MSGDNAVERADAGRSATWVIAIDGPSGSGKSSTAKGVATHLEAIYVDTGAMYRAVTWRVLQEGIDVGAAQKIADAVQSWSADSLNGTVVELSTDPAAPRVAIGGIDVTEAIREPDVGAAVSAVSAVPQVRETLITAQRALVVQAQQNQRSIVMEGRDIGTVVLPEADVKIFLTADVEVRALRRSREDAQRGTSLTAEPEAAVSATHEHLLRRDQKDSTRAVSPLRAADDAITIDATHLTLEQVIDAVLEALPYPAGPTT